MLLFLENGYSSKNLCKAPKEFILTLADKSNMTRLHEDNHECKKSCTNAACQENYVIIEGNVFLSTLPFSSHQNVGHAQWVSNLLQTF